MPLVRKLDTDWNPIEANDKTKYPNGFNVGDTIVITDPGVLLKNRSVILVNEETGEDIPFSTSLDCQFCAFSTSKLKEYTKHLGIHVQRIENTKEVIKDEVDEIAKILDEPKTYSCKQCDFTTQKVIQLAQHARLSHPSNVYVPSKPTK